MQPFLTSRADFTQGRGPTPGPLPSRPYVTVPTIVCPAITQGPNPKHSLAEVSRWQPNSQRCYVWHLAAETQLRRCHRGTSATLRLICATRPPRSPTPGHPENATSDERWIGSERRPGIKPYFRPRRPPMPDLICPNVGFDWFWFYFVFTSLTCRRVRLYPC